MSQQSAATTVRQSVLVDAPIVNAFKMVTEDFGNAGEQRIEMPAKMQRLKQRLDGAGVRNNGIEHDNQSGADSITF